MAYLVGDDLTNINYVNDRFFLNSKIPELIIFFDLFTLNLRLHKNIQSQLN